MLLLLGLVGLDELLEIFRAEVVLLGVLGRYCLDLVDQLHGRVHIMAQVERINLLKKLQNRLKLRNRLSFDSLLLLKELRLWVRQELLWLGLMMD